MIKGRRGLVVEQDGRVDLRHSEGMVGIERQEIVGIQTVKAQVMG